MLRKKILPVTLLIILIFNTSSSFGYSDGSLDSNFGSNGVVQGTVATFYDSILQSDGKLIAVGKTSANRGVAVRFNSNGSIDETFGISGIFETTRATEIFGVEISSNKIILVGTTSTTGVIIQIDESGSLDTTFSTDGYEEFINSNSRFTSVKIQTDGKILTAGYQGSAGLIARYTSSGVLDTSFSTDGYDLITSSVINDLAIDASGSIYVAGYINSNDALIAKYASNGTLDTSFDSDGKKSYDFSGRDDSITKIILQTDDKIFLAGASDDFILTFRIDLAGNFDSAFSDDGYLLTSSPNILNSGDYDYVEEAKLQDDGKYIISGLSETSTNVFILLARLNSNGTIDQSFGTNGFVLNNFDFSDPTLNSLILLDDYIYAAGKTNNLSSLVMRFSKKDGQFQPQSAICPDATPGKNETISLANKVKPYRVDNGNFFSLLSMIFEMIKISKTNSTSTATLVLKEWGCNDALIKISKPRNIQFIVGGVDLNAPVFGYIQTPNKKWQKLGKIKPGKDTAVFTDTLNFKKNGRYIIHITQYPKDELASPSFGNKTARFVVELKQKKKK